MSVRDREEMVVARLSTLAPHLDGEPDPDFRAATRARLVAMAAVRTPEPEPVSRLARLLAGRAQPTTRGRWQTRLTAGVAGAALTVTAAAALLVVAGDALPGDVLYDVKRGAEQTQLALAGDSRGPTLLQFAATRLDELEKLVDAPTALPSVGGTTSQGTTVLAADADAELVLTTLATMDDQTTEGARLMAGAAVADDDGAPLGELATWAAEQSEGLAALQSLLPDGTETAVGDSLALLAGVRDRTSQLQLSLACPGGPAVVGSDALGPVPAACPPAPAPPADGGTGDGTADDQAGPGTTSVGSGPEAPPAGPEASLPSPPPVPGGSGALPTTPSVPGVPGPDLPPGSPAPSVPGSPLPPFELDLCVGDLRLADDC